MSTSDVTPAQFRNAMDRFIVSGEVTSQRLQHVVGRFFSDPPGGELLPTYLEQIRQQTPDLMPSFVEWEIPPVPSQYSDTYLTRAFLTQLDQKPQPDEENDVLLEQLKSVFEQRNVQILIITHWQHLLSPKRGTVNRRATTYLVKLFLSELPPVHILALGEIESLTHIMESTQRFSSIFQPLAIPQPEDATSSLADQVTERILDMAFTEEHDHQGEAGNDDVHRLIHVAEDLMDQGERSHAEDILAEAEFLATKRSARTWLAQIALTRGVFFDHSGEPEAAIPFLERALRGFEEENITRMAVNSSIFLGNMLAKTGQPIRALRVLDHALELTEPPSDIEELERAYDRFGIYRELGLAYRFLGDTDAALDAYIAASKVEPVVVTISDTQNLSLQILRTLAGAERFAAAIDFGTKMLDDPIGTQPEDWVFLAELQFEMGLIYLQTSQSQASISASKHATNYYLQLRELSDRRKPAELDLAFLGRLYVNTGTAYGQLNQVYTALAYWRRGLEILEQAQAHDADVPRNNIAELKAMCRSSSSYAALLQASEPEYQQIGF